MAGRGPAPKPPEQRRRKNADPVQRTTLGPPPKRAPQLRITRSKSCRSETREWWKKWASSPNASQFTPVMWERLQMLALLVNRFHEDPTATVFAEIRRAEAELGAMPADRARLRWDMPDSGSSGSKGKSEGPKAGADFKERQQAALKLVQGGA